VDLEKAAPHLLNRTTFISSAMSSVTSTDTSVPATSSPPPASSSQLTSGTNYFFGFLIAFIAFLFVFLSLGLLARRRRMRLMHEYLLHGPDDADLKFPQTEPEMWQPPYAEAKGQMWNDMMPLAATPVRRDVVEEFPKADESDGARWHNPFVVYFGFPAAKPRRNGRRKTKVTEALNIAVMISMPQAPDSREEKGDRNEYQIGMLKVPWRDNTQAPTS